MEAGQLPSGHEILRCVGPVILVIILRALYGFARLLPSQPLWFVRSLALAAKLLGLTDLLILFLGGLALFIHYRKVHSSHHAIIFAGVPPVELFAVFYKIGAVLFGSGYTLLLYFPDDLVIDWAG